MAGKKAEARAERVVSARQLVTERDSGSKLSSLNLPEGASLLQIKKACTLKVDVLPYEITKANVNPFKKQKGQLHFERTYYVHRNVGPENGTYCCLALTFRQACPVCEYRAQLAREPEGNEKEISSLKPSERQLFNLIDLGDKEKGIQIFDYSQWLFGKVLNAKIKRYDDHRYDFFADLKQGLTIEMTFDESKSGGYTSYPCIEIQFLPRLKAYKESILEKVYDLDEIPRMVPYTELKKIFLQVPPDEDEEEKDEEDVKEALKTKGKGKSKIKDEDEDEDEDKEDEDEDEEDKAATAEDMGIVVGTMVEHEEHGTCEVVHVSSDGTALRIKDEDDAVHRAVTPSECKVIKSKKKGKKEESPAKKGKKKPDPEPEEDEDDDTDEDDSEIEEEEEEEEKPVKKKGKKPAPVKEKTKKKKDEDEDDDDEDDDEDEWDDD